MDPDGARSAGGRQEVAWSLQPRASREGFSRAMSAVIGIVMETLPSAMYKVRLDEGSLVVAHIADRIDRNFVRLLVGDRVRLELSPVDSRRGRIVEKL
jgi:translation initiation factor IF-1